MTSKYLAVEIPCGESRRFPLCVSVEGGNATPHSDQRSENATPHSDQRSEKEKYVLSEQCAEGFFDLADGDELNVELLPVQAREVVLGDDDV